MPDNDEPEHQEDEELDESTTDSTDSKPKDKLVQEIITHINTIEQKVNSLKDTIAETKDMIIVNQLDIINLKNEIDKLRLTTNAVSPESAEMLQNLGKSLEKTKKIDMLDDVINEINKIKQEMKNIKQAETIKKTGPKKCSECGAKLSETARFCKKCGKKV